MQIVENVLVEEAAFWAYSTTWKKFLSRKHGTVDKGNFRRGWKGENEEHKESGEGGPRAPC